MKIKKIIIGNEIFYKSSHSERDKYCVGVGYENGYYKIVNTKEKKTFITFTEKEWDIFIDSVKKGYFDDIKNKFA
jgi:hypothetical protein